MTERPASSDDGWWAALRPSRLGHDGWRFGIAVVLVVVETSIVSCLARIAPDGTTAALFVFLPLALVAVVLVGQGRVRAAEGERRRREADALVTRLAALRRLAALVARGPDPAEVYPAGVAELAGGLGVDHVMLVGFDAGTSCTVLAVHGRTDVPSMPVGERITLDGDSIVDRVRRTGKAARIDDYAHAEGAIASRLRELGLQCGAGAPVTIDDQLRGALIVGSACPGPMPGHTEEYVGDVVDLIATAIANAESRATLSAPRARIVAAADRVRAGFAGDLHDGVQQRIAALGLGLRTIEASVSPDEQAVRSQLDNVINGLADLYKEVQELSRRLHPAVLSTDGLEPALRVLARRAAVPVSVEVAVDRRLPESIERAVYFVVAEALAHAELHSRARRVAIRVGLGPDELHVDVADDGSGGAPAADGLIDLRDRVEAVSGRLDVSTPRGGGTTWVARIPTGGAATG